MMALTGFWQFVASVVGLVVLAYTLRLNRDATKAAVAVAQANAKLELRAYLSLAPAAIFYDAGPRQFQIIVNQKNKGQTPANKVRFFGCVEFQDHPLKDDFQFPLPEYEPGVNVIHPGHGFAVRPKRTISEQDMWTLTGDDVDKRIYFLGALVCDDVFGREHVTRACRWYSNAALFYEINMPATHQQNGAEAGLVPVRPDYFFTDRFNDAT